jgi:hypothetical protein
VNQTDLWLRVARQLEGIAVRSDDLEPQQIQAEYDAAESAFLDECETLGRGLELRRRVAEWRLLVLSSKDVPFETIEALRKLNLELGYINIEREANVEIRYARACREHGRVEEAREVLEGLVGKLDARLEVRDTVLTRALRAAAASAIDEA